MATYKRKFKVRKIQIVQVSLILSLVVFIIFQFANVSAMKECTKVINYVGSIRSGSQQLVKLELAEYKSDPLITKINSIFECLEDGDRVYNLMKIKGRVFQVNIQHTLEYWQILKNQIKIFRETGKESSILLQMSETFFSMTDNIDFASQLIFEKLSTRQNILEIILILIIIANFVILEKQAIDGIKFRKMAFTDKHTKLPNKSRCEEILNDTTPLDKNTGFIMLDLNYLKRVNDTLGHAAGDAMILSFATTVRKSVPPQHFVGRYGGDEFICVLKNVQANDIQDIIGNLNAEMERFNKFSKQIDISFSYGYDFSGNYIECTMRTLLAQADKNMYETKKKMHAIRDFYNKLED